MKYAMLAAVAVLCLVSMLIAAWKLNDSRPKPTMAPPLEEEPAVITNTTTIPPPTEQPTEEPTPPTKAQTILVYYDALGRPYYPTVYEKYGRRHPHRLPYKRHYYPSPLEPAGGFPDLLGMQKEKAVQYVMTTFPNLTVAPIRYGHRMPADTRMDRMIIVFDAFTGHVVSAYIG